MLVSEFCAVDDATLSRYKGHIKSCPLPKPQNTRTNVGVNDITFVKYIAVSSVCVVGTIGVNG